MVGKADVRRLALSAGQGLDRAGWTSYRPGLTDIKARQVCSMWKKAVGALLSVEQLPFDVDCDLVLTTVLNLAGEADRGQDIIRQGGGHIGPHRADQ